MAARTEKRSKSIMAVYAIILLLYVLAFLMITFPKTVTGWLSFGFTIVAMVGSYMICRYAFDTEKPLVSKVYGYPVFRVGVIYALAQITIGIVFCVISIFVAIPYWVSLLLYLILLGAAAIGVIITDNTRDIVEEIQETTKVNTKSITYFQIDISGITDICRNTEVKADLEKLKEQFRFSDPVSSDATKEIESRIQGMLQELKNLAVQGSTEEIRTAIENIALTLTERNRICKANK